MKTNISEFPTHPLPHVPVPQEPQRTRVQPTVFVYEKQQWEYKVLNKEASGETALTEDELNGFGKDGWELVGVVPLAGTVQFFFKRLRN